MNWTSCHVWTSHLPLTVRVIDALFGLTENTAEPVPEQSAESRESLHAVQKKKKEKKKPEPRKPLCPTLEAYRHRQGEEEEEEEERVLVGGQNSWN